MIRYTFFIQIKIETIVSSYIFDSFRQKPFFLNIFNDTLIIVMLGHMYIGIRYL